MLIPVNSNNVSLIYLLNKCFDTKLVEVTYLCESCKTKKKYSKSLKISILPKIPIIHFNDLIIIIILKMNV